MVSTGKTSRHGMFPYRDLEQDERIPAFHDDDGTAIISGAALWNALEVAGKDIGKIRLLIDGSGAMAAAIAGC